MSHMPGYSNHSFCCFTLSAQVCLGTRALILHYTFDVLILSLAITFDGFEELVDV